MKNKTQIVDVEILRGGTTNIKVVFTHKKKNKKKQGLYLDVKIKGKVLSLDFQLWICHLYNFKNSVKVSSWWHRILRSRIGNCDLIPDVWRKMSCCLISEALFLQILSSWQISLHFVLKSLCFKVTAWWRWKKSSIFKRYLSEVKCTVFWLIDRPAALQSVVLWICFSSSDYIPRKGINN